MIGQAVYIVYLSGRNFEITKPPKHYRYVEWLPTIYVNDGQGS